MAPFKGSLPAYRMKAVVKPAGDKPAADSSKDSSKSKSTLPATSSKVRIRMRQHTKQMRPALD
eukprot:2500691-Pyramimonas_sp.AAC.1